MDYNEERAEALRTAGHQLGDMLAQKAAAYGNAQDAQRALWRVLLEPYAAHDVNDRVSHYRLPPELLDHVPRLTRVLDRICRIVANPSQDRMGEDTWKDLAGDAIAGMVMPRTCSEPGCERTQGHEGQHGAFDARGVTRWGAGGRNAGPGPVRFEDMDAPSRSGPYEKCGTTGCSRASGHEGRHSPEAYLPAVAFGDSGLAPMAEAALDGLGGEG